MYLVTPDCFLYFFFLIAPCIFSSSCIVPLGTIKLNEKQLKEVSELKRAQETVGH